jgi:hypothetical protein
MGMTDRFDLPVTATSVGAIDDYVTAVDLLLSADTGVEQGLTRAIVADPDFASHISRMPGCGSCRRGRSRPQR